MEEETEQQQSKNYNRLVTLLIDIGGEALRDVLLNEFPQNQLGTAIQNNITLLSRLKSMKVLTEPQFDLLQETPPDPNKFDISLLVALLRNLCPHIKPVPDRKISVPDPGDHSMRAELLRIKNIRNKFMHISTTSMPKSTFQQLWLDLAVTIIRIALNVSPECGEKIWTKVVLLKVADIDPAGENGRQLHSTLVDWKRQIIDKTQIIDNLDEKVNSLQSSFESLHLKSDANSKQLTTLIDRVSQLTEDVSIIRQDVPSMSNQAQGGGDSVPAQRSDITNIEEQLLYLRQELASMKHQIHLLSERTQTEQPDFFFPQDRSSDQSQISLPGCFLQIEDRRTMVYEQKLLVDAAKSVGKLCSRNICGTCFRVGHKYVMTARHVVMGIVNNGIISLGRGPPTSFAALDSEDVYVTFNFEDNYTTTPRKFYLTSSVVFEDEALDIAVVELKPDQELPSPFCNFGMAKPGSKFVFLGHPFGELKQMNDVDGLIALTPETKEAAVAWSIKVASIDGFAGIDKPGRILFHCSFQEGGSGSPGIAVEGKKVVVVTILLQGYPDWFYAPGFNQDIKNRVEKGSRIEQGVNMLAVFEKMQNVNVDLCYAIFGKPNE